MLYVHHQSGQSMHIHLSKYYCIENVRYKYEYTVHGKVRISTPSTVLCTPPTVSTPGGFLRLPPHSLTHLRFHGATPSCAHNKLSDSHINSHAAPHTPSGQQSGRARGIYNGARREVFRRPEAWVPMPG